MLRIFLILTIVVGLAALGITHLKVGEEVTTLRTDLATTQEAKTKADADLAKAVSERNKAFEEKQKADKELEETVAQRDTLDKLAKEQRKRADTYEANLEKVTMERNEARQELTAWTALGIPVDQIKRLQADLRKTTEEREALKGEAVILNRNNRELSTKLARYEGDKVEVEMPGLKGKVLAVDPKYDFVILDIGRNQGAQEFGKLMVSRDGKLVAKLQIVRVEQDRCVANVLPEWKQASVVEGDAVLY